MSNEKATVLRTMNRVIHQEYYNIKRLLSRAEKDNPLGRYVRPIQGKLADRDARARTLLIRIDGAISPSEPTEQDLEAAWEAYVELKTEIMPVLSSELLAVIGGVHLMKQKLDNAQDLPGRNDDDNAQEQRAEDDVAEAFTSFSEIAEQLVDDLVTRTVADWAQVLIVGEERFGFGEAGIIRLRFPAYDIWNLPFTAHEYGYLIAQRRPPYRLSNFRDQVRLSVDPTKHELGSPPEHQACYLQAVQDLWQDYHDEWDDDQRENFREGPKSEVDALEKRQQAHLCRLFADAFATFFVGPAYVHALLHLGFVPDDTLYEPTHNIPPFAHRFCFALETLKWMNDKPVTTSHESRLFDGEVDESTGIPDLWRKTLESANQEDRYDEILHAHEPWLTQIKNVLEEHYNTDMAIDRTYGNWKIAEGLKDQLAKMTPKLQRTRPPMWAVLNAAWSARLEHPGDFDGTRIDENALHFLDKHDWRFVERASKEGLPPDVRDANGAQSERERKRAQAIKIVRKALQEHSEEKDSDETRKALKRFNDMVTDPSGIRLDEGIRDILSSWYPDALKSYKFLCP